MTGNAAVLGRSAHLDTFCRDNLPPAAQWPDLRFDLADLRYPDRLNAAVELLDTTIARYGGDRPCLLAPDGSSWTYAEVRERANRIAGVLVRELGVVPGNRVLLRGPNNPWLVACWLGALRAGAVAVATMPLLRATELATIAEIAQVDLALCDHRFLDDLVAADIAGLRVMPFGGSGADDLTDLIGAQPAEFDAVDTSADDVAVLAFTSGTTGRPKATMHFHRDLLACADTFSAAVIQPNPDDIFTGTPPLAFTFGLGSIVLFPLRAGASVLLLERTTPEELAELIAEHGVTICSTAPTAYRAILASGNAGKLASLRRGVSAGEHLPETTWQAFLDQTGVKLIDGIGSTEMLHVFISSADDQIRPGSTGRVVPGYRAAVLDDSGQPVPPGQLGRLAVQGPTGCRYLADTRQSVYVQNGWNLTGDTFSQDADGYFYYHARSDDMIVSSGYNIAGPEVEEALMAHDDVVECGVVGVPDDARGALVKAFVVLRSGVSPGADQTKLLQDFVKARIAPYKYPREIEFVSVLPRTATGKLQRFLLRQQPGMR
jgi:2-aminobenzoate-CoA ligase